MLFSHLISIEIWWNGAVQIADDLRLVLLCPIQQIESIVAGSAHRRYEIEPPVFPFSVKLDHLRDGLGVNPILLLFATDPECTAP